MRGPFFALFRPFSPPKKIRLSHRGVRYEEEKLETATPKKRNFGGRIWEPKVHFCQQNGAGNAFIPTTRFPTLSVLPNFTLFGPKRPSEQNVLFLFFSSPKMPQIWGFFLARFEAPPKPLHPMQTHGIKITKLAKFGLFPSKKILKNCNSPKYIHFFIQNCPF